MDPTIERTNNQIKDKGNRLKQKAEMMLKSVRYKQEEHLYKKSDNNLPSTAFWVVAGVTAITAVVAPYKPVSLAICACAIYGGVKSRKESRVKQVQQGCSLESINQLTTQLIDTVESIKDEWDSFMGQKKEVIQSLIKVVDVDEKIRSQLYSYSYVTESIIFRVADIISEMNKLSHTEDVVTSFSSIKSNLYHKLCNAIDIAVNNQQNKYEKIDSLLN